LRRLTSVTPQAGYDASLQELQSQVQEHVNSLLSDSSTTVKRALLCHVGALCTFFGRLKANDAILAHLVTYLNTRDWLLRVAWNENAVDVASCVGSRSLEEYILPLITLSLAGAYISDSSWPLLMLSF
jgi:phosphoinositide-3-kinase regulatory subunit 4